MFLTCLSIVTKGLNGQGPLTFEFRGSVMHLRNTTLFEYICHVHIFLNVLVGNSVGIKSSDTVIMCLCVIYFSVLRLEPTELCDGNYHRNRTVQFWSNGITSLYRK